MSTQATTVSWSVSNVHTGQYLLVLLVWRYRTDISLEINPGLSTAPWWMHCLTDVKWKARVGSMWAVMSETDVYVQVRPKEEHGHDQSETTAFIVKPPHGKAALLQHLPGRKPQRLIQGWELNIFIHVIPWKMTPLFSKSLNNCSHLKEHTSSRGARCSSDDSSQLWHAWNV